MSYDFFRKGELELFWKLLNFSSIDYIVIHGDWNGNSSIIKTLPIETWQSILNCPKTTILQIDQEKPIVFDFPLTNKDYRNLSIRLLYKKPEKLKGLYLPLISIGCEKPVDKGIFLGFDLPSQAIVLGFKDKNGSRYQIKYPLENILPNLWTNITGNIAIEVNTTHIELFINKKKVNDIVVAATPEFTENKIFVGFGGNEHLQKSEIADLIIDIDNEKIVLPANNTRIECKYPIEQVKNVGKLTIIKLQNTLPIIRINDDSESSLVDEINQASLSNISLNYKKVDFFRVNPTLWKVQINSTKPFMLSFAESFDPLWEARIYRNGKLIEKVKPLPLYGVINGFWINTTGENLQVIIRYTPQDWFEIGLVISGLTFASCILYLFYDWRRSKGDRWVKKLEGRLKTRLTSQRDDASVRSRQV
ncbi:MAG: hypothetical protein QXV37_04400 [Candidatus Jordarchaeaceae archaeon]